MKEIIDVQLVVKQGQIQGIDVIGVKRQVMIKMSEEQYDIDDMLVEDDIPEDESQPCRCEFDDNARKGFVSYQVDDEGGYEERPCPECNKNDWQNKKHCEKCSGTGMYYDDPEKAKVRTGRY